MTPSDSPTGAPTLTDEQIDQTILDCPMEGHAMMAVMGAEVTVAEFRDTLRRWARALFAARAALSAQAPPSETVDRALNVFHEYAESQARAGAQAPPAPDPRELLLQWVDLDAISSGAARRSAREMLTAKTCHYLNSTEAGTPQAAIGAPPHLQNNDEVICPACCHQFRAIPVNVQRLMLDAGFEPPFNAAPSGHPAQAVASSPTPSLGHQTESDSSAVQRPVDGDRA